MIWRRRLWLETSMPLAALTMPFLHRSEFFPLVGREQWRNLLTSLSEDFAHVASGLKTDRFEFRGIPFNDGCDFGRLFGSQFEFVAKAFYHALRQRATVPTEMKWPLIPTSNQETNGSAGKKHQEKSKR